MMQRYKTFLFPQNFLNKKKEANKNVSPPRKRTEKGCLFTYQ